MGNIPWSKKEEFMLLQAVEVYNCQWFRIAQYMHIIKKPNEVIRTEAACRIKYLRLKGANY